MNKDLSEAIFVVLILAEVFIFSAANAVCCREKANVCNTVHGFEICEAICMDGLPLGRDIYCGIGKCNLFGCNCAHGCRSNSLNTWEEAKRLYANRYLEKFPKILS